MSSSFSSLKFELIGTGEQSGTWGATTNANLGTAIEQAIVGMATLTSSDFTANVATLTLSNTTAAQNARALCLVVSASSLSAAGTINVPAIQKPYLIINNDSYAVTVKVSGLTGVAVPAGKRTVVYNNGTDVGNQVDYLATLALGTALPISSGGTGSTSTTFVNLATNVTGTLPVANGGTGSTTATGTGSVVLATSPTLVTPALGTPVSGNFSTGTFTWPTFNQNTSGTAAGLSSTLAVASGGTGLATTPANGQIDIGNGTGFTRTTLTAGSNITITNSAGGISIASTNPGGTVTGVTATAPVVSSGGTAPVISMGVASSSADGYLSSTDWSTFNNKQPAGSYITSGGALGTPSSGNLANCTFPTLNQNTTGTAAGLSATLAVASGGTGTTTPNLVAGTNVTLSGTWPNQTINAIGGGSGSVTSVAALTLGTTGTDLSSTVATGTTTPVITLNVPTASASNRGALSAADWSTFNNKQAAGSYVTVGGALGTPSSGTLTNCTFPTLNQNTTGTAAGLSATLAVASGGTGVTSSTGSGSVVLSTSPSLTTPALGTPASGTLSSCTVDGTDKVGFLNIPQNSQSAAYTLVLADAGKHIFHPSTDANARTYTIPANSSVAYPIGTAITFINMTSQVVTIAITTDTMYLSSAGTTGSRSLAQYGSATAIKMTATTWLISGSGLT